MSQPINFKKVAAIVSGREIPEWKFHPGQLVLIGNVFEPHDEIEDPYAGHVGIVLDQFENLRLTRVLMPLWGDENLSTRRLLRINGLEYAAAMLRRLRRGGFEVPNEEAQNV